VARGDQLVDALLILAAEPERPRHERAAHDPKGGDGSALNVFHVS